MLSLDTDAGQNTKDRRCGLSLTSASRSLERHMPDTAIAKGTYVSNLRVDLSIR